MNISVSGLRWAAAAFCLLFCLPLPAAFKDHLVFYGFVRNYFTYDSRECVAGTGDLFNYLPKDHLWNETAEEAAVSGVPREDLNALSTFRFLSLTTRAGLDISGYEWGRTQFGATLEADFYAGLSKTMAHPVTGVAQLRLRHAYITLAWDSLRMHDSYARLDLLIGQTWHPMTEGLADVLSINGGAPFEPFNRSPQVRFSARLGRYVTLTAAALWQMQYTSVGPSGHSAEYLLYAKTPEGYAGLTFHTDALVLRAGADVLSIRPRRYGSVNGVTVTVKDRLTTVSPFVFLCYEQSGWTVKAKSVFAQSGEHMALNGGYGVTQVLPDGSWRYTPTRNSSSWISCAYGGKVGKEMTLRGSLFGGYVRNFGVSEPLTDADGDGAADLYFSRNSFPNMERMWRVTPAVEWITGKFHVGCEYELTSVQYDTHWVSNHRVQVMTKYCF